MPFFGGVSDYKIIATNIRGGNGSGADVSGSDNIVLGNNSLTGSSLVSSHLIIGHDSGVNLPDSDRQTIVIGHGSLRFPASVDGFNVIIGNGNFLSASTVNNTVAIGLSRPSDDPETHSSNSVLIAPSRFIQNAADSVFIGNGDLAASSFTLLSDTVFIGSTNQSAPIFGESQITSAVGVGRSVDISDECVGIGAGVVAGPGSVSIGFQAEALDNGIAIGVGVNAPANTITIGDPSHTSITIGGIPFTGGGGGPTIIYTGSWAGRPLSPPLDAYAFINDIGNGALMRWNGANWRAVNPVLLYSRAASLTAPISSFTGASNGTFVLPGVTGNGVPIPAGLLTGGARLQCEALFTRTTALASADCRITLNNVDNSTGINALNLFSNSLTPAVFRATRPFTECTLSGAPSNIFSTTGLLGPGVQASFLAGDQTAAFNNSAQTFICAGIGAANAGDNFRLAYMSVTLL